jgi:hypothetical protein
MRYDEVAQVARPFDLVLVRGWDFISNAISKLQEFKLGDGSFTHVGMIVDKRVLPWLPKNQLYIWESTAAGEFGDGVQNIANRNILGVQIRELKQVVAATISKRGGAIAIARVIDNPISRRLRETDEQYAKRFDKVCKLMQSIYRQNNGKMYQILACNQCCSLFSCCKQMRSCTESDSLVFCSQLVADAYIQLGILPNSIDPRDVIPMDFLGFDLDGMPKIVHPYQQITCI